MDSLRENWGNSPESSKCFRKKANERGSDLCRFTSVAQSTSTPISQVLMAEHSHATRTACTPSGQLPLETITLCEGSQQEELSLGADHELGSQLCSPSAAEDNTSISPPRTQSSHLTLLPAWTTQDPAPPCGSLYLRHRSLGPSCFCFSPRPALCWHQKWGTWFVLCWMHLLLFSAKALP